MSAQHTPGPLFVELRDESESHGNQYAIQNASSDRYADLPWGDVYVHFSGYFGSYGPHLFAAAPELLELLKECREFFASCQAYDGADTNNLDTRCMDAIAKATGEQA